MDINITKLTELENGIIGHLHENGYSKDTEKRYHSVFSYIRKVVSTTNVRTYEEVLVRYKKEHVAKNYNHFDSPLTTIRHFDATGEYPAKYCRLIGSGESGYERLPDEFRRVIDAYREHDLARGKLETTVNGESISGITFLLRMAREGIDSLGDITEEAVLRAFRDDAGCLNKSCSYQKNVKAVFRGCLGSDTFDPEIIRRIISFLPKLKQTRKNIQYLTQEEFGLLKSCLLAEESPLCLRDRAIGLLAMYTGLRSCDIMALEMDSIDWERDVIRISQQKTAVRWNLELPPVVGNAVFDYITKERPRTEVAEIFISRHHPYGRMAASSATNIARSIMKASGIRDNPGDRMGLHLFRHHLATELLAGDVPIPVISDILGHSSPRSTEAYLSADFTHLKECALSIEEFPMDLEVLR